MTGESQQTPESVPDPSVFTTEAVARAVTAERDFVKGQIAVLKERLNGIDEATRVLNETVTRTPTEIEKQTKHVRELLQAQLSGYLELQKQRTDGIDKHFEHLDKVRAEDKREARALVDLALNAQKEASSTALTAANLAIDKAAESTGKRYDVLDSAVGEMRVAMAAMMPRKESEARHSAHELAVAGLSSRVTAIESLKQGAKDQMAGLYALIACVVSIIVVFGVLSAAGVFHKP